MSGRVRRFRYQQSEARYYVAGPRSPEPPLDAAETPITLTTPYPS